MQINPTIKTFTTGGGTTILNEPINVSKALRANRDYTRPSSLDSSPLPSIRFSVNGKHVFWVYPDETTRDIDFVAVNSLWKEDSNDPYWDVSRGLHPDKDYELVFGFNGDVGAAIKEDAWNVGGLFPYHDTAVQLSISSTSANDSLVGSGARTIKVFGLNANFDRIEEIVELDGTNTVLTTLLFLREHKASVLTAGSLQSNEGDIFIRNSSNSDVVAKIDAGLNNTQMIHRTVPRGFTAVILSGKAYLNKDSGQELRQAKFVFSVRPFGGVFSTGITFLVSENIDFNMLLKGVVAAPEKSDLRILVSDASSGGSSVSGYYEYLLIKNPV